MLRQLPTYDPYIPKTPSENQTSYIMSSTRHSRRQQQLTPERPPRDDINLVGLKRSRLDQLETAAPNTKGAAHLAELEALRETYHNNQGHLPDIVPSTNVGTHSDVHNEEEAPTDLRADSGPTTNGEYVAVGGEVPDSSSEDDSLHDTNVRIPPTTTTNSDTGTNHSPLLPTPTANEGREGSPRPLGPVQRASTDQGNAQSGKQQPQRAATRKRARRRGGKQRKGFKPAAKNSNTSKVEAFLAEQKALMAQYELRLDRLTAQQPPSSPPKARDSHKRKRASSDSDENPAFVVRGRSKPSHGLGYESPATSDNVSNAGSTPSVEEIRLKQKQAKQNPHGQEALENLHDHLHARASVSRRRREFEQEAASDYVPTHHTQKNPHPPPTGDSSSSSDEETPTPRPTPKKVMTPPLDPLPTPESIEESRQRLHARILKLSDELYRAIDGNDTARATAIQPILETLRATYESRTAQKKKVPPPKNWPEYPASRYHLNNIMERDTRGALVEAWKNAEIAGLDDSWSLTWFYKVLTHFRAEKSTLDYIRDNTVKLKLWTPQLQIEQICSHETQATVDPALRKVARGFSLDVKVPVMEQMTQLMENHRRAHERCSTDAEFKQNLLNHCIVQLLEAALNGRSYERTLQLHPKWHLMETHELLQLLSPDIQEAQQRTTSRVAHRARTDAAAAASGATARPSSGRPGTISGQRPSQNWPQRTATPTTATTCAACLSQTPPGSRHIPSCHNYRTHQPAAAPSRTPQYGQPQPQRSPAAAPTAATQGAAPMRQFNQPRPQASPQINTITQPDDLTPISEEGAVHINTILTNEYDDYSEEAVPPQGEWEQVPEQA